MSLFSKLFGGGGGKTSAPEPVLYKAFAITPTPIREGPRFRISARIEKDGKVHTLIRADTVEDAESAADISTRKAKQVIDEQGDRIFG